MNIFFLTILTAVGLFLPTTANPEPLPILDNPVPILAINGATEDALTGIFDQSPYLYLIVVGLLTSTIALSIVVRVLWKRTESLDEEKNNLQESRVKISMATTEAIKEAITLVQNIYETVSALDRSEGERKLLDVEIKNHLINISKDVDDIKREIIRTN